MNYLQAALRNKKSLKVATDAGCYSCGETFLSEAVVHWTDQDQTALCPFCGMDAVLPNVTTKEALIQIKKEILA